MDADDNDKDSDDRDPDEDSEDDEENDDYEEINFASPDFDTNELKLPPNLNNDTYIWLFCGYYNTNDDTNFPILQ